jgi:hypothetical protein
MSDRLQKNKMLQYVKKMGRLSLGRLLEGIIWDGKVIF